jgi:hypothetical protein
MSDSKDSRVVSVAQCNELQCGSSSSFVKCGSALPAESFVKCRVRSLAEKPRASGRQFLLKAAFHNFIHCRSFEVLIYIEVH